MTVPEPNPWSRDGADVRPRPQSDADDPARAEPSGIWPSYPAAPNTFGYDQDEVPAPPTQTAAPLNAYEQPYANPYPTSYPGQNPYLQGGQPQTGLAQSPYGYGTSPYGPAHGAYAAGPYGYTLANHPRAVSSLVLGMVGLVICSPAGIIAFILGRRARKEILAQPQRYSGLGVATAGWVMGMIAIAITIFYVLFFAVGMAGGFDS